MSYKNGQKFKYSHDAPWATSATGQRKTLSPADTAPVGVGVLAAYFPVVYDETSAKQMFLSSKDGFLENSFTFESYAEVLRQAENDFLHSSFELALDLELYQEKDRYNFIEAPDKLGDHEKLPKGKIELKVFVHQLMYCLRNHFCFSSKKAFMEGKALAARAVEADRSAAGWTRDLILLNELETELGLVPVSVKSKFENDMAQVSYFAYRWMAAQRLKSIFEVYDSMSKSMSDHGTLSDVVIQKMKEAVRHETGVELKHIRFPEEVLCEIQEVDAFDERLTFNYRGAMTQEDDQILISHLFEKS